MGATQSIFTESAHLAVCCVCVCAIWETRLPVDWRLLVKEPIFNIVLRLDFSGFCRFYDILHFEIFSGLWVIAYQPTVHNGEVCRGRVCGCGCWR